MKKRRLPKYSVETYFFIGAVVLCVVSAALLYIALQARSSPSFAGIPSSHTITHGSATIGIDQIRREKGSGPYAAPAGKEYIVLRLSVRNNIDIPLTIAPTSDTYLKTTSGDMAYVSPMSLETPFRSGQLLPGETIRGELSYLVNEKATYMYYLESDWTGGVVSLLLQ